MSYGGQPNTPWQRNIMQSHPQSGGFHQGSQMFMQSAQQNNMAAFGHSGMQSGGGNMFPGGGAGGGGGNVVAYPQPRSGLNPVAFQQDTSGQSHYNSMGTVTKISNECGLVNDEVFFYRNVCKGPEPKLGDRVIFEATYSNNGQFKWNATRVQIMQQPQPLMSSNKSGYNSVAPPNDYHRSQMRRNSPKRSPIRTRHDRDHRERERPQRSRDRDETDEQDRKRRREERSRERDRGLGANNRSAVTANEGRTGHAARSDKEREPKKKEREVTDREREERDRERERARDLETHRAGPKGRRARTIKRYMVEIPKSLLPIKTADVQDLRRRFSTLYIPSDFFHANIKWSNTFTPDNPFSLRRPCQFHIMHEFVEAPNEQTLDLLEPPDANYLYSAKVMLMSLPPIAEIYKKCFESDNDDADSHAVHPSRLINFLVGVKGRVGSMAIGGPWSPSLDGENPDKDPSVLIRTAIRTCKALTAIDLSNCTQWYRFVELYYHRTEYKNMEKNGPPRIETVVIYLPDVHSCLSNLEEWQTLAQTYKNAADGVIARRSALVAAAAAKGNDDDNDNSNNDDTDMVDNSNVGEDAEEINTDNEEEATITENELEYVGEEEVGNENERPQQDEEAEEQEEKMEDSTASAAAEDIANNDEDDDVQIMDAEEEHAKTKTTAAVDENDEPAPEPTHYTQLDLKTMKVLEIRDELLARNLSDKGVRNVVMARLAKALNTEKAEETKKKIIKAKQQLKSRNAINKPSKEEEKIEVNTESSNSKTTAAKNPLEAAKIKKISVDLEEKENANDAAKSPTKDKSAAKGKGDKEEDWADIIDFELSDIVILDEYDSSKNAEEATLKEMTEKEKIQLIRRYTLPTTPHIVVHPNRQAKGGKFDCAVVSLSLLLDYHPDDSKERFFEVSLFAELFNDMLMRDFGFNIYKELYLYEDNTNGNSSSNEANETKPEVDIKQIKTKPNDEIKKEIDANKEKSSKKEAKTSNEDKFGKEHHNDDTQSIKSESRKRKISTSTSLVNGKEREAADASDKKMVVIKPLLLLSFVYFDTTHCGYIFERDLEDLFSVLGLNLSRAQIKKVLGKLATRQGIYYRKLTEKEESVEATPSIEDIDNSSIEELKRIAAGNNQYESVFDRNRAYNQLSALEKDESGNKEGLINFNGTVVHVGKLLSQINRTEKNYSDLEKLYNDLLIQHTDLQKHHTKSSSKIKDLQAEVKSVSRKLTDANQDFYSLNRKFRDQNATLSYIYTRVAPYFIKEKDKDKEGKSGEGFRDKEKEKDKSKDKDSEREKCKEEKEKGKCKEEKDKDKEKPKEDIEKEKSKETKEKEKSTEDKEKEKFKDIKEKDKEKEKPKEDKEKEKPKEDKEKEKPKEDKEKEKPKEDKEKENPREDKEKEIKKIDNKPAKDDKEKSKDVREKEIQPKIIKEKPKEKAKEDIKTKATTKDVKVKPMAPKNIDKGKPLTPAAKKVTGITKVVKKTDNAVSKK